MKLPILLALHPGRCVLLALMSGLSCISTAIAQDHTQPAAAARTASPEGGNNQLTQRIQFEDAGSRVDELRVGGQTKSITVQPKVGNAPAYEVQPSDGVRNLPGSRNGSESNTGPRVWNVLKF